MKLADRFKVTKDILWEVSSCHDIVEDMSDNLSVEGSLIETNEGAHFVWRSISGIEVLGLSKLIYEDGPFSFLKLINIAKASIKGFDISKFQSGLADLQGEFTKYRMDTVRDKFVAHKDIVFDEIGIDIHKFCIVKNMAISFFNELSESLGFECYEHDSKIASSWASLFQKKC
jgi:hypothetical protein